MKDALIGEQQVRKKGKQTYLRTPLITITPLRHGPAAAIIRTPR